MVIQEDLLITFGADIIQLQKSQLLFEEDNAPVYYFQIKTGKIKLTNFQTKKRSLFRVFMKRAILLVRFFYSLNINIPLMLF